MIIVFVVIIVVVAVILVVRSRHSDDYYDDDDIEIYHVKGVAESTSDDPAEIAVEMQNVASMPNSESEKQHESEDDENNVTENVRSPNNDYKEVKVLVSNASKVSSVP